MLVLASMEEGGGCGRGEEKNCGGEKEKMVVVDLECRRGGRWLRTATKGLTFSPGWSGQPRLMARTFSRGWPPLVPVGLANRD